MQTTQLHDDDFVKVLWDENTRIIGIDWKEAISAMTDEQFKAELTLFAGYVEQKKARGILVDVLRRLSSLSSCCLHRRRQPSDGLVVGNIV